MGNEILRKFASELKSEREAKGLTIDELHVRTKIDKKFLEAIEEGNYSIMPDVYVRAFVKEYANELGIDTDEVLRKYDLAKKGIDYQKMETSSEEHSDKPNIEKNESKSFTDNSIKTNEREVEQQKKNYNIYYYVIGGILLLIIFYFILLPKDEEKIVVERKYSPAKVETKSEKTVIPVEKKKEIAPFSVRLSGTDTVWIRAQIDNKKTEEFTLVPEVSRIIAVQDTLKLVVGNSAGIKLQIDNRPIEIIGRKGEVKNIVLTRNGLVKK